MNIRYKQHKILVILLFIAMNIGAAHAVPMYYTFEGVIDTLYDPAGEAVNAGFAIGSNVSYTILVDFDRTGTSTNYDGSINTYIDTATVDYFYADYISGSAILSPQLTPDGIFPDTIIEYNVGGSDLTPSLESGLFIADILTISNFTVVPSWSVGTSVISGNIFGYGPSQGYMFSTLELVSITPSAVPIPATVWLFGTGLIGLVGVVRRRKS